METVETLHYLPQLVNFKVAYFERFWNYTDLAVIVTAGVMASYRVHLTTSVVALITKKSVADTVAEPSQYSFRDMAMVQKRWEFSVALLLFLAWIKVHRT